MDRTMICLNREKITGFLHKNMPACVIFQILGSYGLFYSINDILDDDKIDSIISKYNIRSKTSLYAPSIIQTEDDALMVARFVNCSPDINWDVGSLQLSYTHLLEYYDTNMGPIPEKSFKYGVKTPRKVYNFDPCMLYHLCQKIGIVTNRTTTLDQLAHGLKLYIQPVDFTRNELHRHIQYYNTTQMINIILNTEHSYTAENQSLEVIYKNLTNSHSVLKKIYPDSPNEAITLACMIYGLDISEASDPVAEYLLLRQNGLEQYIPTDLKFRHKYLHNTDWYFIKKIWKNKFNIFYNTHELQTFALNEGWQHTTDEDPLSYLQLSNVVPNFYFGIHPSILETKTPTTSLILDEPIYEYGLDKILSYGINDSGTFEFFTVDELKEHFTHRGQLTNPLKPNEYISEYGVKKLIKLCQVIINQSITHNNVQTIIKYQQLYEIIDRIEKSKITPCLNQLYAEFKSEIDDYFKLIFEVGLYMRGWKLPKVYFENDSESYPLDSLETVTNIDYYTQLEINVTTAITKLDEFLERSPIQSFLRELPLIKKNGDVYEKSTNIEDGLAIIDRINICKLGTSILSCIRTSSNHFLATTYYYVHLVLKNPEPFDIKKLSLIS